MHGHVELHGVVGALSEERLDRHADELRLVGAELEAELHVDDVAFHLDPVRLRGEGHARAPDQVVGAHVAELHRVVLDAHRLGAAAPVARDAADVEDVGEVRGEIEPQVDPHRVRVVVLHADPFVEPPVDRTDPSDVQRLLSHRDLVALVQVRVRQVHVGHVAALRRGGQQHRVAAGQRHVEQ